MCNSLKSFKEWIKKWIPENCRRDWKVEKIYYVSAALSTDLPKAFGYLPHSLAIATLHAHGTNKTSTEYSKDYLNNRKQDKTRLLVNEIIYCMKSHKPLYSVHPY